MKPLHGQELQETVNARLMGRGSIRTYFEPAWSDVLSEPQQTCLMSALDKPPLSTTVRSRNARSDNRNSFGGNEMRAVFVGIIWFLASTMAGPLPARSADPAIEGLWFSTVTPLVVNWDLPTVDRLKVGLRQHRTQTTTTQSCNSPAKKHNLFQMRRSELGARGPFANVLRFLWARVAQLLHVVPLWPDKPGPLLAGTDISD